MTIAITIQGDDAPAVLKTLQELLAGRTLANVDRPAPIPAGSDATPAVDVPASVPAGAKPGRRKAPAADAVIDQPKAEPVPEPQSGERMLTVDDARENMKKIAAEPNGMDLVTKALEHFGVKKVSDIDPDAKGKPSVKFGAFITKLEELAKGEG